MTDKQVAGVATEAVKIYFGYNVSAREAIEKAKEELGYEKVVDVEKTN